MDLTLYSNVMFENSGYLYTLFRSKQGLWKAVDSHKNEKGHKSNHVWCGV